MSIQSLDLRKLAAMEAATVRSIGVSHNMGTHVPEELCRIPAGCFVVEMKYCEMCGRPFSREPKPHLKIHRKISDFDHPLSRVLVEVDIIKDMGDRLCSHCIELPFTQADLAEKLREAQEKYKEQLPNLDSIHASIHPTRYDRSLEPVGRNTQAHKISRSAGLRKGARNSLEIRERKRLAIENIKQAFRERGRH